MNRFYSHIGRRLQNVAVLIFHLCLVAGGVAGACILFLKASNGDFLQGLLLGALCFGAGALVGWLSSCLLYAFGQLVDDNERSVQLLEEIAARLRK